ncbi:MAG: hypothetical protein P4L41_16375 [Flavipsychrobacter sp.]|nr:hypothetical protein [Flavipsychrobacter sp.]
MPIAEVFFAEVAFTDAGVYDTDCAGADTEMLLITSTNDLNFSRVTSTASSMFFKTFSVVVLNVFHTSFSWLTNATCSNSSSISLSVYSCLRIYTKCASFLPKASSLSLLWSRPGR